MTQSNFLRAYDIIAQGIAAEDHPGDITKRLLKNWLLVPDLPEPTVEDSGPVWELNRWIKYVYPRNKTIIAGVEEGYYEALDMDEAEHLALALLAAIKAMYGGN